MSVILLLAGANILGTIWEFVEWFLQKHYNKTHTKRRPKKNLIKC